MLFDVCRLPSEVAVGAWHLHLNVIMHTILETPTRHSIGPLVSGKPLLHCGQTTISKRAYRLPTTISLRDTTCHVVSRKLIVSRCYHRILDAILTHPVQRHCQFFVLQLSFSELFLGCLHLRGDHSCRIARGRNISVMIRYIMYAPRCRSIAKRPYR
jgi:hypothetical protein